MINIYNQHAVASTPPPPPLPRNVIQRVILLCPRPQKETASDQQLHLAALQGNVDQLKKVLESGKVHVDSKDKVRARTHSPPPATDGHTRTHSWRCLPQYNVQSSLY